jgi:adenylate kinase
VNLILLGPPGAGKGTQAKKIAESYGLSHISTGEALREAARHGTGLGRQAKEYMERGDLVPDDLVVGIVEEYLKGLDVSGYLLDGFPRTVVQAEALDRLTEGTSQAVDKVLNLEIPDDRVIGRISGRRVCERCSEEYHLLAKPPKKEGICDKDGGKLVQRSDDREEAVRERISTYHKRTKPLADYYRRRDRLVTVDGTGEIEEVFRRVRRALDGE